MWDPIRVGDYLTRGVLNELVLNLGFRKSYLYRIPKLFKTIVRTWKDFPGFQTMAGVA